MFNKDFISNLIKEQMTNKSLVAPAISIFERIVNENTFANTYTIYNLSKLIPSEYYLNDEDLYRIGFELSNISIPVFTIIVKYEDHDGVEVTFEEREEIESIFFKEKIEHPTSRVLLNYEEYKDDIYMLFKSNYELIQLIQEVDEH